MEKNILFKIFLLTFFIFISTSITSQISEGGMPPSLSSSIILKKSVHPTIIPIEFSVNQLKKEDAITEETGAPLRIAYNIDTNLNMENSGEWSVAENGQRIWRLPIKCPGAIALILKYSDFKIPVGAKLFIYNNDYSHILGAYTEKTNPSGESFATEAVAGDYIILEYIESNDTQNNHKPQILISGIGYCYNYISVSRSLRSGINGSGSCQVNINCQEGDEWQHHKKGVARTLTPFDDGWYLCSGSLVNNTSDTIKPYYLSAHHCFFDDAKKPAAFEQMIFYFHFESPGCERTTDTPPTTKTMVGAQLLVDMDIDGKSDGALLLLNENIPTSYDVYYNGWDSREIVPQKGVGIHHPKGDLKKISTFTTPAKSSTWWDGKIRGDQNAHWNVVFSATKNGHSVTEGGSSGSPLFNENKLIVGTLSGGNSSCTYKTGNNLYGKFSYHWNAYTQKIKTYLDAANTGKTFLEGRYEVDTLRVDFSSNTLSIVERDSIVLKNITYGGHTYNWTFEGGHPYTSTDKNPTVTYDTPGIYDVKLTVDKGMPTEKSLIKEQYIEVKDWIGVVVPNSFIAVVDSLKDRINLQWKRRGIPSDLDISPAEKDTILSRNKKEMSNTFQRESVTRYRVLSKWTIEDMAAYKSIVLTAVGFIPCNGMTSCTIKIRQDGVDIFSKQINNLTSDLYNNIQLDVPVNVDLSKDLYLGYEVNSADKILASYGDDEIIRERNILWFNNKNYYAESFGIKGNWNIHADAKVIRKSDFWYAIHRDGQLLASDITTGFYIDEAIDLSQKSHCYTVMAIFRDGKVLSSETQCVDIPIFEKDVLLVLDKVAKQLRIVPKSKIQYIYIYSLSGQLLDQYIGKPDLTPMILSTDRWGERICIIYIKTDRGINLYKIFI